MPPDTPADTWAEVKQFGWGLLMIAPFIAVFAYGARVLVGARTAMWLGAGIMGIAIVCYGAVIVVSLLASYGVEAAVRLRNRVRGS